MKRTTDLWDAAAQRRYRTDHAALLARIHRRFKTVTETHSIGPLRLPFTRVADPDVVLDQIVVEEDRREKLSGVRRDGNDLHLPYWAELWDSAFGIGKQIVEGGEWRVEGKRSVPYAPLSTLHSSPSIPDSPPPTLHSPHPTVLDLGCGMGLAGMVAAAMGADVLLADLESDALLFAQLNTLRWTDRVRTRQLNWQMDRLDESFDLILGADVLYDRKQWDYLEPFFKAHLRPSGSILLGEPGRQTGDLFPDWISPRGWKLRHLEQRVATRQKPIRIFSLQSAR